MRSYRIVQPLRAVSFRLTERIAQRLLDQPLAERPRDASETVLAAGRTLLKLLVALCQLERNELQARAP